MLKWKLGSNRLEERMKRRRLGRTGLMVSEISLGTVELGLDYGIDAAGGGARPDEAAAAALLGRALDAGINYIDTARAYGASEQIIGRALKARRNEYILASKVSSFSKERLPAQQLRQRVEASIEASLRALRTATIDIMMVHAAPGDRLDAGPVWEALQRRRQAGDIRFLGASVYGEQAALEALATGYDCLQIAYNLLDRGPEDRVLPQASACGAGVVARSVLLKGALTHRYLRLPAVMEPLQRAVEQVLETLGGSRERLPEIAYRYVLAHPGVASALVGTSSMAELEAVIGYARRGPPTEELLERLRLIQVSEQRWLNPAYWPI